MTVQVFSLNAQKYCSVQRKKVFIMQNTARRGTNSSLFLNIGDTFEPQVFLGVVLCIKNESILLKCQNGIFTPPTRGLKKRTPPLYGEK